MIRRIQALNYRCLRYVRRHSTISRFRAGTICLREKITFLNQSVIRFMAADCRFRQDHGPFRFKMREAKYFSRRNILID